MGCDIHCHVEQLNSKGNWRVTKDFESDFYEKDDPTFGTSEYKYAKTPIDCRNYLLFAVLADVRNGFGFAGRETHVPLKPIAECKGLPDNVSGTVFEDHEAWDCDAHSTSWLTVKELKEFDWNQKVDYQEGDAKTVKHYLKHFMENTLPQLEDRCEKEDLTDVRIVFWFDN